MTSRLERSASRSCSSSASRPTKLLNCSRRLPAGVGGAVARAGTELAATLTGASAGSWARTRAWSFPQRRPGVDAELAGQAVTDFGVGAQRLGLPSALVQGDDAQFPEALAERVLAAPRLQFGGELAVAAQHQVSSGPGFDRHQGQLVQPGPFGIEKAGVGEVGQRLTPPQAERFAQGGGRVRAARPASASRASLRHQLLEADDIDVPGADGQGIAGFGGDDRSGPEGAAQLADLGLQGVGGVGRLPVAPQHVDQPVGADRLPRLQGQQRQQRPLLGPADRHRHACQRRFELAEQPYLHEATLGPASAARQCHLSGRAHAAI